MKIRAKWVHVNEYRIGSTSGHKRVADDSRLHASAVTPVRDTRRSHARGIALMLIGGAASYVAMVFLLGVSEWQSLAASEQLDLGCLVFLAWWWIAYFAFSHFQFDGGPGPFTLFTLRSYLDDTSSHRGPITSRPSAATPSTDNTALREKAVSSRDVQGILLAVIVLLLTVAVTSQTSDFHFAGVAHFHDLLRPVLFGLALIIVLCWIISLDIFDTVLNSFQVTPTEAYRLRRYYYRDIGPFHQSAKHRIWPSGGVSLGYVGNALMSLFVLAIFSWFQPSIGGFGTAFYVLFAYPFYFGYWAIKVPSEVVSKELIEQTELVEGIDWRAVEGSDDLVKVRKRWIVNRDGDLGVRTVGGSVDRSRGQQADPRWIWPILLFLGFTAAGIVACLR